MVARVFIAALFAASPLYVQAVTEPVVPADVSHSELTYVSRASTGTDGRYVDVQVLRNFAGTTTLGNDPETGAAMYPHRSVTLNYKVDCDANRLAVSEWQMFDGYLATGQIVWSQKNTERLGFVDAVNAEMSAVMRSACATSTVYR